MKKEKEIWKNIKDYDNLYQISNLGRVRSLDRYVKHSVANVNILRKGKIIIGCIDNIGYRHVSLYKNKKGKTFKIHKLVATAFLNHTPCGHKLVVDHINNNKLDNRVNNLQLISSRENSTKENRGDSNYIGVGYHKSSSKWRSRIQINGINKNLGLFNNEFDAHLAYQKELIKLSKYDQ